MLFLKKLINLSTVININEVNQKIIINKKTKLVQFRSTENKKI